MSVNTTQLNIEEKLKSIEEKISVVDGKDVFLIIAVIVVALVAIINLILNIIDRKKKKNQPLMPQSIVIQPNGTSNGKSAKSERGKQSVNDKESLPSKSMKMKVAISPGMVTIKKNKLNEAKSSDDEKGISLTKTSSLSSIKRVEPSDKLKKDVLAGITATAITSDASGSTAEAVPTIPVTTATTGDQVSTANPGIPVAVNLPSTKATTSSSITSFTVPQDAGTTNMTSTTGRSSIGIIPSSKPPSTPTATTLSGIDSSSKTAETAVSLTKPTVSPAPSTPVNTAVSSFPTSPGVVVVPPSAPVVPVAVVPVSTIPTPAVVTPVTTAIPATPNDKKI